MKCLPYHLNERYLISSNGLVFDKETSSYIDHVFVRRSDTAIGLENTKASVLLRKKNGLPMYKYVAYLIAEVFLNNNKSMTKGQKVEFKDGNIKNVDLSNLRVIRRTNGMAKMRSRSDGHSDCWMNGDSEIYC